MAEASGPEEHADEQREYSTTMYLHVQSTSQTEDNASKQNTRAASAAAPAQAGEADDARAELAARLSTGAKSSDKIQVDGQS